MNHVPDAISLNSISRDEGVEQFYFRYATDRRQLFSLTDNKPIFMTPHADSKLSTKKAPHTPVAASPSSRNATPRAKKQLGKS